MARVVGGDLVMGSNAGPSEEQPEHPITVTSFCVDVAEVSVAEYGECVKRNGCAPPQPTVDWSGVTKEERDTFSAFCNFGKEGRREHPMNCISFEEAAAYCKWSGKRVPTEEQWEYAARGHEARAFPWGHQAPGPRLVNGCDDGCARAARRPVENLGPQLAGDDGWEATSPVGAYPEGVSVFGAFDMAGNVAEWVDAPFCPYGQSVCGTGSRVIRGGSWMTDTPVALRATSRAKANPTTRQPDVGVRCVK
jgi:formylglycine-generating enzyme required for sulfatase activity